MGIVPRSISTIKEWREPSGNWSPKTRSGDKADLVHGSLVRELYAERQRIACGASLLRKSGDDVAGVDELHVAPGASGDLQRNQEIDDLQLMLDERAADNYRQGRF